MRQEWPLVGRAEELDFARRTLATPSLSGLVLAGRPGAGRSRMLREVLAAAAGSGAVALEVRATSAAAGIPFGAIAPLLPDLDRGLDEAGTLRAAGAALLAHAGGKRLVLGIDDAAHLDPATAALVAQLCHARQAFVVLTVQVGVPVSEAVFGLWKDGIAERLDLAELDRARSDELVAAVLGGHVDGALRQKLWELARGTPLFLRELIVDGLASGTLTCVDEVWSRTGELTPGPRLLELVESRMGALTEDEGTLLELLAHGAPLGSEVLLEMGAERVLGRAERRGLVVSALDGRRLDVELVHPLYTEVVRRRTTPLRARRTHRILVQAIEDTGARRASDGPRLASWRLAAGRPVTVDALVAAAAVATDLRVAEHLVRAAVAASGGADALTARVALAEVLVARGRAAELGPLPAGTPPRSVAVLATARPGSAGSVGSGGSVQDPVVRAALALAAGRGTEAVDLLAPLEAAPEVLAVQAIALCATARYADAVTAAERGLAADPGWWAPALQSALVAAHALDGRLATAEELASLHYTAALARHWPVAAAVHAGWLGRIALMRGRVRTARGWLREAAAHPGPFPEVTGLFAELAVSVGLTGDPAAAEALLPETDPGDTLDAGVAGSPWPLLARSWLAAVRGESTLAARLVAQAAETAREGGLRHAELVALHDAVRMGAASSADRARELADQTQGELAAARSAHVSAIDGPALEAVADRFAALGTPLFAAEAGAQAVRIYDTAGRAGSKQGAAKRVTAWTRLCEETRTPALTQLSAPTELTRRELEIARLAASGMTSKAIAARLVVSVRTVDNVLHSVYAKLGVAGRAELAGAV